MVILDPLTRELYVGIQLEEIESTDDSRIRFQKTIWQDLIRYFIIIAGDSYLALLSRFFDKIVLQINSIREDPGHTDVAYPVLSCIVESRILRVLQSLPNTTQNRFAKLADVRFNGGVEIEPRL